MAILIGIGARLDHGFPALLFYSFLHLSSTLYLQLLTQLYIYMHKVQIRPKVKAQWLQTMGRQLYTT
jgi:hypothetical protein